MYELNGIEYTLEQLNDMGTLSAERICQIVEVADDLKRAGCTEIHIGENEIIGQAKHTTHKHFYETIEQMWAITKRLIEIGYSCQDNTTWNGIDKTFK